MNTEPTSREFSALMRQDFPSFVRNTFATLNPNETFFDNWHLDAIAYQLEEIDAGNITRLAVAIPPRALKSTIFSVAYPAYRMGLDPTTRIVCISYSQKLSETLARNFRTVVKAEWYQRAFPEMRAAKDTADEFITSKGGVRLATSIGGTLTGRGGSLIIIDDPLSAEGASSDADRERANDFYRSTVVTRLDNKASGVIILVMQRLHEEDLFGTIKREGGYTELVLPAIAPCEQKIQIGPDRWRTRAEGEVLDAKREPLHVLEGLRRTKGSGQFQAQYQQAPVPAGGNMIKREWFKTFDLSLLRHQAGDQVVQSWDTAMKGGEHNDYSVCTTWKLRDRLSYLIDVRRQQCDFPTLQRLAKEEYLRHQPDVVLIEDKGSGTALIQDLSQGNQVPCIAIQPEGDKVTRLSVASPLIEAGTVLIPKDAPWLCQKNLG